MRTLFAPVTVYGQRECRPCLRVCAKLSEADIDFDYVDLSTNEEAKSYVVNVLEASTLPVVVSDHFETIIGYQPDKLKLLIESFS